MAALFGRVTVSAVTSGTTALTLIQLLAATNQRVRIREFGVSFQGTTNTDGPVLVQLMIQTSAGTKSSGTLVGIDGDYQETIQTAASITYTVEPTYSSVLWADYVHPQGLPFVMIFNPTSCPILKGGTRVGLVVTAPQTHATAAHIEFEE